MRLAGQNFFGSKGASYMIYFETDQKLMKKFNTSIVIAKKGVTQPPGSSDQYIVREGGKSKKVTSPPIKMRILHIPLCALHVTSHLLFFANFWVLADRAGHGSTGL